MNLVLFEPEELGRPLPHADPRARHLREVLRRGVGGTFDAGLVDGDLGTATVTADDAAGLHLDFLATRAPPPLPAVTLVLGLPRPATARDVLRDATTLGVAAIHFVVTERTTASYASSSLWAPAAIREQLKLGAAQAFDTRLPVVTAGRTLSAVLRDDSVPIAALDNYEATAHLATRPAAAGAPVTLVLGPERGFGPDDRAALRAAGATLWHLGPRVLRLETAVVAALSLVHGGASR